MVYVGPFRELVGKTEMAASEERSSVGDSGRSGQQNLKLHLTPQFPQWEKFHHVFDKEIPPAAETTYIY